MLNDFASLPQIQPKRLILAGSASVMTLALRPSLSTTAVCTIVGKIREQRKSFEEKFEIRLQITIHQRDILDITLIYININIIYRYTVKYRFIIEISIIYIK